MATQYVTEEAGTFIPATQRPDGTWRKARRVKDGYVPQDEMPLYESKGKQWAKSRTGLPPGLNASEVAAVLEKRSAALSKSIPGLGNTETVSKSSKKKKKKKQAQKEQELCKELEEINISANHDADEAENVTKKKGVQPLCTDPAKRIKNLKKKLREIETLKEKIKSGQLANPEKDQLDKIARKEEIEAEIDELELELDMDN